MTKVPKALWRGLSDLYHTTYTREKTRHRMVTTLRVLIITLG